MPTFNAIEFYEAECNAVHALCDRARVPQKLNGELLSMSQRVNILEGINAGLLVRFVDVDPVTLQ